MTALATLIDPDEVRGLIDASLTERDLPSTHIRRKSFINPAIAEILRRDPDAETRADVALERITTAVNCLVAVGVLPTVPNLTKEDFGEAGGYTRVAIDVTKRSAELRNQAYEEIALAINPVPVQTRSSSTVPKLFGVAKARRY